MQANATTGWVPASDAWLEFARKHPEFGIAPTQGSWIHFSRTHVEKLIECDVVLRSMYRNRLLADAGRFEQAVFNLLTSGSVEGRRAAGGNA